MARQLAVDSEVREEPKSHGLTSWLKSKFFGPKIENFHERKQLEAELADLKQVGRYEIVGKLGQGSMGMVYLGKDPYIKRDVAIKISRPSRGLAEEEAEKYKERFFTEAQSAGRLTHPNIVAIYDAGIQNEFCYITMEYIDGPTLHKFCKKEKLLPVSKVIEIIFVVCRALDYAHRKGIVHRDIKPSNIMLNSSGAVKITDFGIAHVDSTQSSPTGLVGSPCYMSPEQVKEEPIIDKSDIFSLGCVLYELLTGTKAFSGDNYFSILYKITHEEPIPLRRIRPDVPDIIQKIVSKALAKNPDQRYQTCLDFAYDLRVALRGIKGGG